MKQSFQFVDFKSRIFFSCIQGSAGIGRTGMLILMDTALSLLNVNEPVYPLDIVKNMRDQRPCMVQNVVGYMSHTMEYLIRFVHSISLLNTLIIKSNPVILVSV